MVKPLTSVDAPLSLVSRYPELEEHLSDMKGFFLYVQTRLNGFGLTNRYSPEDIINECLLRWHKAVQDGKSVPMIAGWMRVTAGYIIHELSREVKKTNPYEPDTLETLTSIGAVEQHNSNSDEYQLIHQALKTLAKDKQELLKLRWLQDMSWDAIAEFYGSRGKRVKAATLRKRGERALKELRQVYQEEVCRCVL